ncbi:TIGR03943 family putative permease subunit [Syntrophorhabdus aromaticivorans]|uniref:TIGR03943 family putative permease subunit n=1 Tax=Syntrophorhabdus aromaticivorans TaxID=328301 RepID=UPI000420A6B8|nr:TIGR03943 family protein [Syntrophorhabdus aromaticivorans]
MAEGKRHISVAALIEPCVFLAYAGVLLFLLLGLRYRYFLNPLFGTGLAVALFLCTVLAVALIKTRNSREERGRLRTAARAGVLVLPLLYAFASTGNFLDSQAAGRWVPFLPAQQAGSEKGDPLDTLLDLSGGEEDDDEQLVENYRSSTPKRIPNILRRMLGLPPEDRAPEPDSQPHSNNPTALSASLLDLNEFGRRYKGRHVVTEGMVAWDKTSRGRFYLFRFVIVCCVADALPVAVLVEWPEEKRPAQNSWIRVEGIADRVTVDGQKGVVIKNGLITPIPVPKDPYLY